jgi:glycosidase
MSGGKTMSHWVYESIFYHIYPLGFCQAPQFNDFSSQPVNRLEAVSRWIPYIKNLNANALYLGPVFESSEHGYDTANYYEVDRRLGTNENLKQLVSELHGNGVKVILDGVFNHVGRNFFAFQDLLHHRENSIYKDWFCRVIFGQNNSYNDGLSYEGWQGHFNLVKLNLSHPDVKGHIFSAVKMWIEEFGIDGLRLDVAYCMDVNFLKELAHFTKSIKSDFWLVGEVLHGDYRVWMNPETLDSVTNYECYKGLYSSFNDKNLFEIASSFNRQFGEHGLYKGKAMYNFVDNHDVTRQASILQNPSNLYPLYALLFSMPGVPSVYYGSEWGIEGMREYSSDQPLRPGIEYILNPEHQKHKPLADAIAKFASIRKGSEAIKYGGYGQVQITNQQFAFLRQSQNESIIVLVNASDNIESLTMYNLNFMGNKLVDILNNNEIFEIRNNRATINHIPPNWARIMRVE